MKLIAEQIHGHRERLNRETFIIKQVRVTNTIAVMAWVGTRTIEIPEYQGPAERISLLGHVIGHLR